ncbi:Terminal nucleotidyltransferase 4A [Borealophlyctis nickersoniae]|nr:Terminal nucleotidyltransferase 4A [Borealophlyctis nickersoniae]
MKPSKVWVDPHDGQPAISNKRRYGETHKAPKMDFKHNPMREPYRRPPARVAPLNTPKSPFDPKRYTRLSGTLALDAIIRDFLSFASPNPATTSLRKAIVKMYEVFVKAALGDNATLKLFGSSASGVHVPTADLDCVIEEFSRYEPDDGPQDVGRGGEKGDEGGEEVEPSLLEQLIADRKKLRAQKQLKLVQRLLSKAKPKLTVGYPLLIRAKVPILKFPDFRSGLELDISYGKSEAHLAVDYVKGVNQDVKDLALVLKHMLKSQGLHNPATGGVGGYALVLWAESFVKMRKQLCPWRDQKDHGRLPQTAWGHEGTPASANPKSTDLGALFLDFLRVFGKEFNYKKHGLCPSDSGFLVDKKFKGWESLFAIQDPLNSSNNVTKMSHQFPKVRAFLSDCYDKLNPRVNDTENSGVTESSEKSHEKVDAKTDELSPKWQMQALLAIPPQDLLRIQHLEHLAAVAEKDGERGLLNTRLRWVAEGTTLYSEDLPEKKPPPGIFRNSKEVLEWRKGKIAERSNEKIREDMLVDQWKEGWGKSRP